MESLQRQTVQTWEHRRFPTRPLWVSLLLHAVVLAALAAHPGSEPTQPVVVRMLHGQLLAPALPVAVPAPLASPRVLPPEPRINRPAPLVRASAVLPAVPEVLHKVPAPVLPASTFVPVPGGEAAGSAVSREAERPATTALLAESRETGVDAAGLRQYRLALAGELRRHRHYPDMARRAGWTGTTEVRVAIDAAGAPPRAELNRSSGHAQLDEAALQMLRLAAPHIELPGSLRGRSFAVLLPVVFEIED